MELSIYLMDRLNYLEGKNIYLSKIMSFDFIQSKKKTRKIEDISDFWAILDWWSVEPKSR